MVLAVMVSTAGAQPAPQPQPAPATGSGAKNEKAGQEESLQNGGIERPWARGVSEQEQHLALASFREANVQLNDGLFAKAVEKYRDALKHWDHPAIHYNLALALMNIDQTIEAYEHLEVAVKFGEAPLQSKDKFDNAKLYLLRLQKEIAEIEITCNKPGAKVSVDGKQVFVGPGKYAGRVNVGQHQFIAEKSGYNARVIAPYIGGGEHFRIELKVYTAEELTRYHRRWEDAEWLPYAVAGGGLALGVVGGILELSAQGSYQDYDTKVKACNQNDSGCPQSSTLRDLKSSGDTKKSLGYVGYGLAGATIVAAGMLWILNRPEPYRISPEELQNERVTVAPVVAPGYAGAAVQAHF
jgi:tetratricopeptide (TPR) repeat protein